MALKDIKAGTSLKLSKLSTEARKTAPPPRFTESSLVKELECLGVGRPSTYASIVSTIQERGYTRKEGNALIPTPLGFAIVRVLRDAFPDFTAYDYTAAMEEKLESIAEGKLTRTDFLSNFWSGKEGFEATVDEKLSSVDYEALNELKSIDLGNGYSVRHSRFGSFLQDDHGEKNEKGYLPSARLQDDEDLEKLLDPEVCKELIAKAANAPEPQELEPLSSGPYKGWSVVARDGRFGPYLQATPPGKSKEKPVNMGLPEGVKLEDVTQATAEELFSQIKLPRQLTPTMFAGIGKRGPYLGVKATPRARRAVFISLAEGSDPRTITAEEAQRQWDEKQAAKKTKPAPKKAPAKKPAPKRSPRKPKGAA